MNRDESVTRGRAGAPKTWVLAGRRVVYPRDVKGGTWILVNDHRVTMALVNWYGVSRRVTTGRLSRGLVLLALGHLDGAALGPPAFRALPLERLDPFRVIVVDPELRSRSVGGVLEFRWDLKTLSTRTFGWEPKIWASSGEDEPGAQRIRRRVFREALGQVSAGRIDWLRRLHRSRRPQLGPYSICMRRVGAETISYTEVRVAQRRVSVGYQDGMPEGAKRMLCLEMLADSQGMPPGSRLRSCGETAA